MGNPIERHVTFHVFPDKVEEFNRFFREEYRPAMQKSEGFLHAGLLRLMEDAPDLKMVLRFESSNSAAAWRESQAHAALKPHLKSLYSGSELLVYEVLV